MKKKICFVVSSPFTGMFLVNQLKELSKYYTIYLVANITDANKSILSHQQFDGYHSVPIGRSIQLYNDLKATYLLYRYFKKMNFDAIHSITPKAGLISALAGKLARVPNRFHIYTGQVWATKTGFFKWLLKQLDKVIARLTTQVLVDGHSQRDFLVAEGVLKKDQGRVLGAGSISGVDLDKFTPNHDVGTAIRAQHKLADDNIVYLYLGRLNTDKGVLELAHAFNKLAQANEKVFLLLVGIDEEGMMEKIHAIITNKDRFYFAGSTPHPEKYYQASDVFCLPSYREGFGMSVIEASACKIPVICSDAYGLLDTIVDNKTGLRHKVKDVEGLFIQMNKLAGDAALRSTLGSNGMKYIQDNFSSEIITDVWVRFYLEQV